MGSQEGSAVGSGGAGRVGRKVVQRLGRSGGAARVAAYERRGETPGGRLDGPKGESSVSSPDAWSRLGAVG